MLNNVDKMLKDVEKEVRKECPLTDFNKIMKIVEEHLLQIREDTLDYKPYIEKIDILENKLSSILECVEALKINGK